MKASEQKIEYNDISKKNSISLNNTVFYVFLGIFIYKSFHYNLLIHLLKILFIKNMLFLFLFIKRKTPPKQTYKYYDNNYF